MSALLIVIPSVALGFAVGLLVGSSDCLRTWTAHEEPNRDMLMRSMLSYRNGKFKTIDECICDVSQRTIPPDPSKMIE